MSVVTPTVDGDVLAVLAGADAEFTPPQVHRLIGEHSVEGVRKVLNRLAAQGIVTQRAAGAAFVYGLNREHVAAPAVIALARAGDALLDRMREALGRWSIQPAYAAIFGSAARGAMRVDSDIDVFIVRPQGVPADDARWRDQIDLFTASAATWSGNDPRVLEYGEHAVRPALRRGERVLRDIAAQARWLAGPQTYMTGVRSRGS